MQSIAIIVFEENEELKKIEQHHGPLKFQVYFDCMCAHSNTNTMDTLQMCDSVNWACLRQSVLAPNAPLETHNTIKSHSQVTQSFIGVMSHCFTGSQVSSSNHVVVSEGEYGLHMPKNDVSRQDAKKIVKNFKMVEHGIESGTTLYVMEKRRVVSEPLWQCLVNK